MKSRRAFPYLLFSHRACFFLRSLAKPDAIVSFFFSPCPCRETVFVGSSQRVRAERAKALGWEPHPVVLEDWAKEGIEAALEKLQK